MGAGAALALDGDELALLAPVVAGMGRACDAAGAVAALAAGAWRPVRAALDVAHARLGALGCPGWPAVPPAVLTHAAWGAAAVAALDADGRDRYDERAGILEHDAGLPRWLAEQFAAEAVAVARVTADGAPGSDEMTAAADVQVNTPVTRYGVPRRPPQA